MKATLRNVKLFIGRFRCPNMISFITREKRFSCSCIIIIKFHSWHCFHLHRCDNSAGRIISLLGRENFILITVLRIQRTLSVYIVTENVKNDCKITASFLAQRCQVITIFVYPVEICMNKACELRLGTENYNSRNFILGGLRIAERD